MKAGAGSDPENESKGSGDSETASNSGGRMKIGVEDALAGISYDFGWSTIAKARIASLESFASYFPKEYG
jgi:hypothetical protein